MPNGQLAVRDRVCQYIHDCFSRRERPARRAVVAPAGKLTDEPTRNVIKRQLEAFSAYVDRVSTVGAQ